VQLHGHVHSHAHASMYSCQPKQLFKDRALVVSMGEESSQPTKHANKIIISIFIIVKATILDTHGSKALHSELLTQLSGRFPSRNEYFVISEVQIWHHFFVIFGKFGISKFPKFPKFPNIRKNQFPKFPNFFQNFRSISEPFTELFRTFWPKKRVFCPKTSNFTSFFRNFRIITELFSKLKFPNFFPNFFAKIPRVWKFRFFPKNFRTLKTEHFRNSRKRKVRKFPSNAGPYTVGITWMDKKIYFETFPYDKCSKKV